MVRIQTATRQADWFRKDFELDQSIFITDERLTSLHTQLTMKIFLKKLFVIITVLLIIANNKVVEAVLETNTFNEHNVDNSGSDHIQEVLNNIVKDDGRQGRIFYWNPVLDMVLQSAAQNYVPNNDGDIFDFLQDSYPLPQGKLAYTSMIINY